MAATRAPVSRTGATGFIPPPPGSLRFPEGRVPQNRGARPFLCRPAPLIPESLAERPAPLAGGPPAQPSLRDAMAGGSLPRQPTQRRRLLGPLGLAAGSNDGEVPAARARHARRRRAAPRPAAGASSELPAQPPTAEAREKENEAWGRRSVRGESGRPADRLPKRLRDPVQRKRAGTALRRLGPLLSFALGESVRIRIQGYPTGAAPAARRMPSVTIPTFSTPAPRAASITSMISP